MVLIIIIIIAIIAIDAIVCLRDINLALYDLKGNITLFVTLCSITIDQMLLMDRIEIVVIGNAVAVDVNGRKKGVRMEFGMLRGEFDTASENGINAITTISRCDDDPDLRFPYSLSISFL